MSPAVFRADAISGGYGDIKVVQEQTLAVARGDILCITGRNGVGKTTLLKLLAGFLPLMSGTVTFDGNALDGLPPHRRAGLGIAYAPQENVVFPTLSVRDNLTLHLGRTDLTRYRALFDAFPKLETRLAQIAGTLSGGERKILSFCRAMAERAALTMLDEPSEGVQPENIGRMALAMKQHAAAGAALIVVEQNLALVTEIATRVMVLDHGCCVFAAPQRDGLREEILGYMLL
jgi:urea transport system ATP-binding protein